MPCGCSIGVRDGAEAARVRPETGASITCGVYKVNLNQVVIHICLLLLSDSTHSVLLKLHTGFAQCYIFLYQDCHELFLPREATANSDPCEN